MSKRVVEVQIGAIVAAEGGFAVFLGNREKTFVIFVDQTVGAAIEMSLRGVQKERPLTHDLLANILRELGTKIERVVISDLKCGTCYARLVLTVENELKQKKIMEIDARPSDCIAVATAQRAPIYVSLNVWEELEDMTEALRKLEAEGLHREKKGGEGVS
jgi:bifunctional DNase/RNase